MPMTPRKVEELLESVFTEREQGRDAPASILDHAWTAHAPDKNDDDFRELAALGLVRVEGGHVTLTEEGERRAGTVVRRHRLAERLFSDLLALPEGVVESQACEFEHILSPEATDSVCTLLGHPPTCPHGKPIPPGGCCGTYQRTVRPLVTNLEGLDIGGTGRIVFIAPRSLTHEDELGLGVATAEHHVAPSGV